MGHVQVSRDIGPQHAKQSYGLSEASQEEGDIASLPAAGQQDVRLCFLSGRRQCWCHCCGVDVEVPCDKEHGTDSQRDFSSVAICVPSATLLLIRAMFASMTPGRFFCI